MEHEKDESTRDAGGLAEMRELEKKIDRLHAEDRHAEIVEMLEAAGRDKLDFALISKWGRALNNLERFDEAVEFLNSVAEEGADDADWNFRMGFAYYWSGRQEQALPYFAKAGELNPEDEEALDYVEDCRQAMAARKRLLSDEVLELSRKFGEEGCFARMRETITHYLAEGIQRGWFAYADVERDLETALLIAYANGNIDEYLFYYDSMIRLSKVEDLAGGCGTWFYRYSVALMRVGQVRKAWDYAERGVREEPGYPWGWLQVAKLRSHFGRKEAALEAVEEGLRLVPGDYEFSVLKEEIERGASIEEMENHYIREEDDRQLREGLLEEEAIRSKLTATDTIVCHEENLAAIKEMLKPRDWVADDPFCMCVIDYEDRELECVFEMNEAALSKMDLAWLTRLFTSIGLQDALAEKWLRERFNPVGEDRDLVLERIFVERQHRFELDYGDDIAVLFTKEMKVDETAPMNYDPIVYSDEERNAVLNHIECYFGRVDNLFHERVSPDIHVDVYVVEPTPERNYYTLVTCGVGAYSMKTPEGLSEKQFGRMELVICLPPDWQVESDEERWFWPVRCLKTVGRLPVESGCWMGYGFSFSYENTIAEGVPFCSVALLGVQEGDERSGACRLPNGDRVNFYQLIPLYPKELKMKINKGLDAMVDAMRDVDHVVDIHRKCAVPSFEDAEDKRYFIAPEEIRPLLDDWFEADACRASDRIIEDGCRVGYMYRERPNIPGIPDSGWRFVAGDENQDYMANPDNMGTYSLNTVCNYDPDIVPLLDSPYGTAYYRDGDGQFQREDFEVPDEE